MPDYFAKVGYTWFRSLAESCAKSPPYHLPSDKS